MFLQIQMKESIDSPNNYHIDYHLFHINYFVNIGK